MVISSLKRFSIKSKGHFLICLRGCAYVLCVAARVSLCAGLLIMLAEVRASCIVCTPANLHMAQPNAPMSKTGHIPPAVG
jgi:hypothetical protein